MEERKEQQIWQEKRNNIEEDGRGIKNSEDGRRRKKTIKRRDREKRAARRVVTRKQELEREEHTHTQTSEVEDKKCGRGRKLSRVVIFSHLFLLFI